MYRTVVLHLKPIITNGVLLNAENSDERTQRDEKARKRLENIHRELEKERLTGP